MILNSKVYKVLKWIVIIFLHALALFVEGLGQIWGWPYTEEITLTISAVATFLGALIGYSTYNYYKGK